MVDRQANRTFGFVIGTACALIAAYEMWRGRTGAAQAFAAVGAALGLCAAAAPLVLEWPRRGWTVVGHAMGWVNSRILLSLLFGLVLTPLGLVFRLAGRDSMRRRWRDGQPGWTPYSTARRDPRHYERMY